MKWCKKKIPAVMVCFSLAFVWLFCFLKVNKEYAVEAWEGYRLGETYQAMGREVTWNSLQRMTREEVLEKFDSVLQQEFQQSQISITEGENEYCVVGASIKNLTDVAISPEFFHWEVQCGSYSNGATYMTSLVNAGISDEIQPGETIDVWVFYNINDVFREEMKDHPIRIYVSIYPERIYLEDEL